MLLTKTTKVNWNPANIKWYEEKGYIFTKWKDEFEVKIEDLTKGSYSKIIVNVLCDNPSCEHSSGTVSYKAYIENIKKHSGEYICYNCLRKCLYKFDTKNNLVSKNETNQRICNVENCTSVHVAQGYCEYHYRKLVIREEKCKINGCTEYAYVKGFCKNHYYINKRFGYIPIRNRRDNLEIIEHNNYAEIVLYDINYEPHAYTQIDIEEIDKIKQYKWRVNGNGYVCGWVGDKTIFLHRFLMNAPEDKVVHHKNHIIKDNRKENLVLCTYLENSIDRIDIEQYNNSGYIGIFYNYKNRLNPWAAFLSEKILKEIGKTSSYIGHFHTYDDAVYHRDLYELYYYKEFSPRFDILKNKYKDIFKDIINNGLSGYIKQ